MATRENTAAVAVRGAGHSGETGTGEYRRDGEPSGHPSHPTPGRLEQARRQAGMERQETDQDEEWQHGQRIGHRLGMGNRARHRRRHVPSLERQQPQETGQRRGYVHANPESDHGDQQGDAGYAHPQFADTAHRAVSPSLSERRISASAWAAASWMVGTATGSSPGCSTSRQ